MTVAAGGTGPAGATNGVIGRWVTAFQTKVVTVTTAVARGGTTPIRIGAMPFLGGVGAGDIDSNRPRSRDAAP
jgi:hypothetical protein